MQICPYTSIIVRIEFSPVAEIGVSKGHYYSQSQETTKEEPTLTNAWACYNLTSIFKHY